MTPDPPSSPVETTEPLADTTSYTGVIRGTDEREARWVGLAYDACRAAGNAANSWPEVAAPLIARADAEHAALTAEVERLKNLLGRAQVTAADALVREGDWRGSWSALSDMLSMARDELGIAKAMIATDDTELQAKDALIAERDASIARLTIRLAEDDRDATIERLTTLADNAAENEALRAEVASLRAFQLEPRAPQREDEPCPDSCGGQSWTGVDTNYGRRWRCDTCNRIISRYISDAIQAADDRRSL